MDTEKVLDAIELIKHIIDGDSGYTDAHYNLVMIIEARGVSLSAFDRMMNDIKQAVYASEA
jgi:hypothetical protein